MNSQRKKSWPVWSHISRFLSIFSFWWFKTEKRWKWVKFFLVLVDRTWVFVMVTMKGSVFRWVWDERRDRSLSKALKQTVCVHLRMCVCVFTHVVTSRYERMEKLWIIWLCTNEKLDKCAVGFWTHQEISFFPKAWHTFSVNLCRSHIVLWRFGVIRALLNPNFLCFVFSAVGMWRRDHGVKEELKRACVCACVMNKVL